MHNTRLKKYAWKRFWCPFDKSFSLSDGGYLSDPDSEYGSIVNPSVRALEEIEETQCLVLLGEPGIGKSEAFKEGVQARRERISNEDEVLAVDLAGYGDEQRLFNDLFKSQEFQLWLTGTHTLHFYLDSLDECGLEIPNVAKILSLEFERHQSHLFRLQLRITCRTADWPQLLTEKLPSLWGDEAFGIYELTPLRRKDVSLAASESGLDAAAFLEAISRASAESLAIKPVTLQFLIRTYAQHNQLPSSQAELYEQGCLILCEENNQSRRSARQLGAFSARDRLEMAKRIAVFVLLCNRAAISNASEGELQKSDEIRVRDLADGCFTGSLSESENSHGHVLEALTTGLFSGRGTERMGFAHRTYAEFLAASYLSSSNLEISEKLKLICHPEDLDGRIPPQLHEMAAWLAGMDTRVFQYILLADPQVLIRSDVAQRDAESRKALLGRLLELAEKDELHQRDWGEPGHYHKLSHPEIAVQLSPYLAACSKSASVRRFAIEVAEACSVSELQSQLCEISLDKKEGLVLRSLAAQTVLHLADSVTHLRLKPLIFNQDGTDPGLRLTAAVLPSLWPEHLTADELFCSLHVPNNTISSSYGYFLAHLLPKTLTVSHLPAALIWASKLSEFDAREHSTRRLLAHIALLGWNNIHNPPVYSEMVKYSMSRLLIHEDIVPCLDETFDADVITRRMIAKSVLISINKFDEHGDSLVYVPPRLIRSSDVMWMLDQLHKESQVEIVRRWAILIDNVLDHEDTQSLDAVILASERNPVLYSELEDRFQPIALDSELAARLSQNHKESLIWKARMDQMRVLQPLDPPPHQRVFAALEACEQGNYWAWLDALHWLHLEEGEADTFLGRDLDVTSFPGWINSDLSTRRRVVLGAEQYLIHVDPQGEDWLGTNSIPGDAYYGYAAFVLLLKERTDNFHALPDGVWNRWAPVIVTRFQDDECQEDAEIAKACASKAPASVNRSLKRIAQGFNRKDGLFTVPHFLQLCWNNNISQTLCVIAGDKSNHPAVNGRFLDLLLDKDCVEARQIAGSLISDEPGLLRGTPRERAVLAAKALICHAPDAGWDIVWPRIQNSGNFGRTVLERVANENRYNPSLANRLTEEQAADLYIWLEREFPRRKTRNKTTGEVREKREAIEEYRDGMLRMLQGRGTQAAIKGLERIQQKLPHLNWMPRIVTEAKRVLLEKTWRPISPVELQEIMQSPKSRLVRSAGELQELILESLQTLQINLQGETPAAIDLWNEINNKRFKPKDENHLSDYIKRHLEKDLSGRGIVSFREVQIRQGEGAGKGERTDIYVSGTVPGVTSEHFETAQVIIEVKGEWNAHLRSAMKDQLVDRYLKDNHCRHGIYLVGWFKCMQWDTNDRRSLACKISSIEDLDQHLKTQASELSGDSMSIRSIVLNSSLRQLAS